ncbi:MAG: hypothetical protein AAFO75_12705, partial [Pseudomonadota bacterium]
MLYYFFQVGLLMLAAYLLGAMIGCFLHRLVAGGSTVAPDLKTAGGTAAAAGAAGVASGASETRNPDNPMIETVALSSPPEVAVDTANRFERVLDEAPDTASSQGASDGLTAASVAAAAAAAGVATVAASGASAAEPKATEPPPSPVAEAGSEGPLAGLIIPATGPVDDLKRIRAIDAFVEGKLNAVGVTQYAQLAALTSEGVRGLGGRIGELGRIHRENWIEQATILAKGGETAYARQLSGFAPAKTWDVQPGDGGYTGPIFGGAVAATAVATAIAPTV